MQAGAQRFPWEQGAYTLARRIISQGYLQQYKLLVVGTTFGKQAAVSTQHVTAKEPTVAKLIVTLYQFNTVAFPQA